MPKFNPLEEYEPLYIKPKGVRYISCCGGRGGGRSHNGIEFLIFKLTHSEYCRAFVFRKIFAELETTTWVEILDCIERTDGLDLTDFHISDAKKKITHLTTGNSITGRGFHKAGSNLKANLKGLPNANLVFIEEAQEIVEKELNQLNDSLRTIKADITVVFAFNMPDKNHILIKRFFDLEPIELKDGNSKCVEGFSVPRAKASRPDHIAIITTYLDNYEHIAESTSVEYERYWFENPEHYYSEIIGYVKTGSSGVIFRFNSNWKKYKKLPDIEFYETYGLDFGGGGNQPNRQKSPDIYEFDEPNGQSTTVLVRLLINRDLMVVYVKLLLYKSFINSSDLSEACKKFTFKYDSEGYIKKSPILADNARGDLIKSLQQDKLTVIGAKTVEGGSSKVNSGITIMKKYTIFIHENDTEGITDISEFCWEAPTNSDKPTDNVSEKHKDYPDAIRYPLVNFDLIGW